MSNLNELFDAFPDYNVFDENEEKNNRVNRTKSEDFKFIQYDEKRDFRVKQPPAQNAVEFPPEAEHSVDYRDDYGVYKVYETRRKNYATIFFFPFTLIWLETFLRIGCQQTLLSFNMIFVVLFSLSFSQLLTVICTFLNSKLNRALVAITTALITVWYCIQIVHFNYYQNFLLISSFKPTPPEPSTFNAIMDVTSYKVFYLLACFVPFVFFLFFGKYIFPFRKIRIAGKICLILLAVLLYFTTATAISLDKNTKSNTSNYFVYHQSCDSKIVQERFGLLTMQRIDFFSK